MPGYRCAYVCSTAEEALHQIPRLQPDVVLMDIHRPRQSGVDCTCRLKGLCPQIQIQILTVYEDNERIFRALKTGAGGHLLPSTSIDLSTSACGAEAEVFAVSGTLINQQDMFMGGSKNGNGSATLKFAGVPSSQYVLQFTPGQTPPVVWQNLSTNPADANGLWQYTDTGAANYTAGFYRALDLP